MLPGCGRNVKEDNIWINITIVESDGGQFVLEVHVGINYFITFNECDTLNVIKDFFKLYIYLLFINLKVLATRNGRDCILRVCLIHYKMGSKQITRSSRSRWILTSVCSICWVFIKTCIFLLWKNVYKTNLTWKHRFHVRFLDIHKVTPSSLGCFGLVSF